VSRTAELVGVLGTVELKYVVFGSIDGVIRMVYMLPPSSDSQSSVSQSDRDCVKGFIITFLSSFSLQPTWTFFCYTQASLQNRYKSSGGIGNLLRFHYGK